MNRADDPDLTFEGTLESFFWQQLGAAQDSEGTELSESVEAYLVHLLAAHARRPEVAGRTSPALATQFLAARERGATALREVGDRALYIAGVVPRCLDRTPVDVRYVSGIGEAAYREVHARSSRLQVFEALADGFGDIVGLLARVVEPEHGDSNLLEIYERWQRTGDARDARRLIAAGVRLGARGSDIVQ
jgi:hypothetical protein